MSDDGRYIELQIETSPEGAELLLGEFAEATGGAELRDGETYVLAPRGRNVVVAHCPPDELEGLLALADETLATARAAGTEVDPVVVRQREAHEDEWRDIWKQFFRATRIGRHFIVRPSWDPGQVADGDNVIDLDPGRAFGTGAHPSTRLCIALMEDLREADPQLNEFLDLGCGSGILSIAASKLWPQAQGLAVDIDPESVACANENLALNRVTTVTTRSGTLADVTEAFPLVVANIQMDVLLLMAPLLPEHVSPGGHVVLSGLLAEQAAPTADAYVEAGFKLKKRLDEGEWAGLLLVAP